jgi:ABC-type lipoprotein export system ATPase subunit
LSASVLLPLFSQIIKQITEQQHRSQCRELSVFENIMLPIWIKIKSNNTEKVETLLELFEIKHLKNMPINALSGGEQQKVSIARALSVSPHFILADEPTSALDQDSRLHLLDILKKAHKSEGCGIIICTHVPEVAAAMDYHIRLDKAF